jgi:serine/threonine protein kinase
MERMREPSEFLAAIRAAGVLAPEHERNLAAWAKAMNADTPAIAKHIHDHDWLTSYQIQRIHNGKGHKLNVGQYVLLDILGEGSMGRVFRARHTRLNREMALKVIRKDRLSNPRVVMRFQQEVRAVGQLVHPNIVLAVDADTVGLVHFVAMELIDGIDLKALIAKHGPMPMHVACEYIRQAAVGLQHAFEQNMVHRDVKPSNLMVTKHGVVKVLDLGLAMLRDPDSEEAEKRVTLAGTVLGTPDFLAPEQAKNSAHVDTRADIYSLGGTLFFLLTGRVPYDAPTAAAKILRHATDPPPSVRAHRPDLPPQLDGLIQWLMAKRPEDRAQVPLQAAMALQPFCAPLPPAPVIQPPAEASNSQAFRIPEDAPSRRRRRQGGRSWRFAFAALAALVIVATIAWVVLKKVKY